MRILSIETDISEHYPCAVFHEGDVLRKWRDQRQLTVQQLAKAAGVDKNTITRAERGENTRTDTLRALVEALGYTLDELHRAVSATGVVLTSAERAHLETWRALSEDGKERAGSFVKMVRDLERKHEETRTTPLPAASQPEQTVAELRMPRAGGAVRRRER